MTEARRAFSVAVYARKGDRVLVIEHRRLKTWLPIGGELEAGETPLEAAVRELREETGIVVELAPLAGALDGVPPGLIGYEEHQAGSKGLHMNFVFVARVPADVDVTPNDEFRALGSSGIRLSGFRTAEPVSRRGITQSCHTGMLLP